MGFWQLKQYTCKYNVLNVIFDEEEVADFASRHRESIQFLHRKVFSSNTQETDGSGGWRGWSTPWTLVKAECVNLRQG